MTEDEVADYAAGDGNMPGPSEAFRVDFSPKHFWKTLGFNKEARAVFIDRFLAKIAGGAFQKNPTPPP